MVFPFILRFLNSFPTSEATITRFFTAHQCVLGKHCLIAFYHRVSIKSFQANHSSFRAERVCCVYKRQTRITRKNPRTMDYHPNLFSLTHRKFVFLQPILSSCSCGTLRVLIAWFPHLDNNTNTRSTIMAPMAADTAHQHISLNGNISALAFVLLIAPY